DAFLDELLCRKHPGQKARDANPRRAQWHAELYLGDAMKPLARPHRTAGMTLVEVMVALALSGTAIAIASSSWLFASRNFAAMVNYTDLDAKSRNAVDQMSRSIREATQLTDFQMTGNTKWFTVTNTTLGTGATYTWRASSRTLACKRS